jgi:hypothetical protein
MVEFDVVSLIELGVLTVGVVIAVLEIRNISQTRRTEVVLQFFNKFSTPEFNELWRHAAMDQRFESAEEWVEKYGARANPEAWNKQVSIVAYYDAAGHILRKGLADLEDIHVYAGPLGIVTVWEKYKPVFEYTRKLVNDPNHRKSFEYLYNETKKRYPQLTSVPQRPVSDR